MTVYSIPARQKILGALLDLVKHQRKIIPIGRNKNIDALLVPYNDQLPIEDINITQINEASKSFDFLDHEPNIYSIKDLKKKYV